MARFFNNPIQSLPAKKASLLLDPFGKNWRGLPLKLTLLDVGQSRQIRKEMPPDLRHAFREAALKTVSKKLAAQIAALPSLWDIHHVVPLSLGSSHKNLVLIYKPLHTAIHLFIDKQTQGMLVGESRTIRIPVRFGPGLVWFMRNTEKPKILHYVAA